MQFQTIGDVMQAVLVHMGHGDQVRAEAGAMLYMTQGISMDTQMQGGLMGGLKRMLVGESLFIPLFRCSVPQGVVAFAAPTPGKVRQLDLAPPASWLCQRDSFLFATSGVDINIAFTKRLRTGIFGGEGFILQRLSGSGTTFIHAGGNFLDFDLRPGESLKVDTGCIVAFEESVTYDIEFVGGFKNTLFGGEGLFLASLRGPGKAVLQTMPFSRLAGRIVGSTSEGSSGLGGVGGTIRDVGRIFGGDE